MTQLKSDDGQELRSDGVTFEIAAWSLPCAGRENRAHRSPNKHVHIYCLTTIARAERIAVDGFRDTDCGTLGRGVMAHLSPVIVKADGLAVIVVLVGDDALAPYIAGDAACIPARVLNAGYAELIDH
jgi:hypothetical protein